MVKWREWFGRGEKKGEEAPSRTDAISGLLQLANTDGETIDLVKVDCQVLLLLLEGGRIYSNARIAEDSDRFAAARDLGSLRDLRGGLLIDLFLALEARARDRKKSTPSNHIEDKTVQERFANALVETRRELGKTAEVLVSGFGEVLAQIPDTEKDQILILRTMPDLAKKLHSPEDRLTAMRGLWLLAKTTHGVGEIGMPEEFGAHLYAFEEELRKVRAEMRDLVDNKMKWHFPPPLEGNKRR